ncbi:MAG: hypothetical protein JW786_00045 [Desulfobacterales bacterium]|nr:hypothetical protein [Desulfobacterales bacterium]
MIKIVREGAYVFAWRAYKVVLDDEVIGKIKNGKKAEFDVPPGKHQLYLQVDWIKSDMVEFNADANVVEFDCGTNLRGFKALFAIFYMYLAPRECIWLRNLSKIRL